MQTCWSILIFWNKFIFENDEVIVSTLLVIQYFTWILSILLLFKILKKITSIKLLFYFYIVLLDKYFKYYFHLLCAFRNIFVFLVLNIVFFLIKYLNKNKTHHLIFCLITMSFAILCRPVFLYFGILMLFYLAIKNGFYTKNFNHTFLILFMPLL